MRRGSLLQLLGIGLLAGCIAAAVALLVPWLPEPASREAGRIHFVFWFTVVICVAIFSLVAALIVYSTIRFRARPDDEEDGLPIHGHTMLEIVWTAIPTLLVTSIAIVSAIVLAKDDAAGRSPMRVNVVGQQFAWTFSYPGTKVQDTGVLRLPLGRSVKLYLNSKDVIHSFWVPQFSQKQDLWPGKTTTVHITPTRLGTYPVICTELCGLGHAFMRTTVIVMKPTAFERWLHGQGQQAARGAPSSSGAAGGKGQSLFSSLGCQSCHSLTGAKGVGPSLKGVFGSTVKLVGGKSVKADAVYLTNSIEDPDKQIVAGFQPGIMSAAIKPHSVSLSDAKALVAFLQQQK